MPDRSQFERIASLETRMDLLEPRLEAIEKRTGEILDRLARYDGKWGGILLVCSAIGMFLTLFKDRILGAVK